MDNSGLIIIKHYCKIAVCEVDKILYVTRSRGMSHMSTIFNIDFSI